ncbi:MAG: hypothetical protein BGP06_14410 [Rhizobiales bacterium 65-9]|nr:extracellular solute-binding protein [Hyphomicrobiales bacterium]OJY36859.1 MAG: hypothetical protein BGP06_14410 [Rhizobiales bacterium 65-9]
MINRRVLGLGGSAFVATLQGARQVRAQAAPKTITIAASMLGEPLRGPKLNAILEEFNASQKDFVVKPVTVPFSSFGTAMFTQMGAGGGPDIIAFDQPNIYAAVAANRLLSLDEAVKGITLLPGNNSLKIKGVQYGVALDIGNYALIYNPELVKKIPTTFAELMAEAKAQTANGNFGYAFRHTRAEEAGMWYDLSNFVYGYGGNWSKDGTPTINADATLAGVRAYKEIYDAGVIPRGADAATYRRMFASGKIAMMVDNGGVPTVLKGTNPNTPIGVALAPFPTKNIGQVMAALAVNANSKAPDAAMAFMRWFLGKGPQTTVQGFLGGSTVATPVPRTKEELDASPYIKVFDSVSDVALPFMPPGLEVQTPQIRGIVVEQVLLALQGQVELKAALDEAQKRVLALPR